MKSFQESDTKCFGDGSFRIKTIQIQYTHSVDIMHKMSSWTCFLEQVGKVLMDLSTNRLNPYNIYHTCEGTSMNRVALFVSFLISNEIKNFNDPRVRRRDALKLISRKQFLV